MTGRFVSGVLVVAVLSGMLFGPLEAQAAVELVAYQFPDPAGGLQSWGFTLISNGDPIEAFGNLSIDGLVHQINPYLGTLYPTVFLDQCESSLPPEYAGCDTHLLLRQNQFSVIAGSPIVETNDESNPAGLYDPSHPYLQFGMGQFGQGEGFMALRPEYQSTSLDFLQVVLPAGYSATLSGMAVCGGTEYPFSFVPALPDKWIALTPEFVDFGETRVGTTASHGVHAAVVSESPVLGSVGGDFHAYGPPFGPQGLSCDLSGSGCDIECTFSPTSRGPFLGGGEMWSSSLEILPGYIDFSGTGVGPVFAAEQAPGTTIEFGDFPAESFFDVFFDLSNATDDPELGNLTKLTIDASIEGDAAGAFEILGADLLELSVSETQQLQIRFNAAGLVPGDHEAQLVLHTDVGAAVGATCLGEVYSFTLHATAVPEPSALASLLALGILLGCRRKPRGVCLT
ncbi:MAG: PEP-CTERM sorting domain-containing protein [Pirellulales bacterium]|nr:PEP-CTERM sorting domain-containing protein [Pirellulales bacterium]